jgi:phosphoglucomutase
MNSLPGNSSIRSANGRPSHAITGMCPSASIWRISGMHLVAWPNPQSSGAMRMRFGMMWRKLGINAESREVGTSECDEPCTGLIQVTFFTISASLASYDRFDTPIYTIPCLRTGTSVISRPTSAQYMEKAIVDKARQWMGEAFDDATREAVAEMMANNPEELTESFYRELEFGTGGLRGIMGPGTNRVNVYTIGMATQGFANYLKLSFSGPISIAIAYDCRNNSKLFARKTAEVFSANGIHAYLFSDLRATPELSFAIRHFGCKGGVVLTASHNPPMYNGYKAYWEDGGQLVAPHDTNVIREVQSITGPEKVQWTANEALITLVDKEVDDAYAQGVLSLCLSPEAVKTNSDMKIVFTALHGTSGTMVPRCLKELGFTHVHEVAEQAAPDGNFPTVKSPNPEEAEALKMAMEQAQVIGADLVMGCDPDADRVGIAVRNPDGNLELLNGNMTGSLLLHYLLTRWSELDKLNERQFTAKTIVTTDLFERISKAHNVPCFNVLTGFKYIGELILKYEGELQFIGGGEESYGYLAGDLVRDKDAVLACTLIAEMCAWAKAQGKSLYDLLIDIYLQHGLFHEDLISLKKEGRSGQQEIAEMMDGLRNDPPKSLAGSDVLWLNDYKLKRSTCLKDGSLIATGLPSSNVLQFITEDGTVVTARPSGTEPKIKFYFSVNAPLNSRAEFSDVKMKLQFKIIQIQQEMRLC